MLFRSGAEEVDRLLADATKGGPVQSNLFAMAKEDADAPVKDVRRLFGEGMYDSVADSLNTAPMLL